MQRIVLKDFIVCRNYLVSIFILSRPWLRFENQQKFLQELRQMTVSGKRYLLQGKGERKQLPRVKVTVDSDLDTIPF